MIKHFCDRCGNEMRHSGHSARILLTVERPTELCDECHSTLYAKIKEVLDWLEPVPPKDGVLRSLRDKRELLRQKAESDGAA
jgi:hypothetical protein